MIRLILRYSRPLYVGSFSNVCKSITTANKQSRFARNAKSVLESCVASNCALQSAISLRYFAMSLGIGRPPPSLDILVFFNDVIKLIW